MNPTVHNWKEVRRLQAWHLKQQGWPQHQIAEALGVSAAVSQWLKRARQDGLQALRHRPPPGAPRRVSPDQMARLPDLLHRGQGWTRKRVAEVIRVACGVRRCQSPYPCGPAPQSLPLDPSEAHVTRPPARRGSHRPLAHGDVASNQKGAATQQRTILFLDESGFYPDRDTLDTNSHVACNVQARRPLAIRGIPGNFTNGQCISLGMVDARCRWGPTIAIRPPAHPNQR